MIDCIVIGILVVIIAAAAFYVYKAKKSGKKCIGCPDGCSCSSKKADQHHWGLPFGWPPLIISCIHELSY